MSKLRRRFAVLYPSEPTIAIGETMLLMLLLKTKLMSFCDCANCKRAGVEVLKSGTNRDKLAGLAVTSFKFIQRTPFSMSVTEKIPSP